MVNSPEKHLDDFKTALKSSLAVNSPEKHLDDFKTALKSSLVVIFPGESMS